MKKKPFGVTEEVSLHAIELQKKFLLRVSQGRVDLTQQGIGVFIDDEASTALRMITRGTSPEQREQVLIDIFSLSVMEQKIVKDFPRLRS